MAAGTTELLIVEQLNALDLFTGEAMDPLIGRIKALVDTHIPDVSTHKGRTEIASLARRVASSKVLLDNLGKDLVTDWKQKAAKVDAVRKDMRGRLDALRDEARLPLTNWEAAEEARLQQEELDRQYDQSWDDAHVEHVLWERERIVREKEAAFARQEADRRAKEEAERREREQQERDARIAREAAERVKREADAAIQREKERAERAERDKAEAEIRAKREAEEAAQRAKAEQEAAVLRAQQQAQAEADRKERARQAAEQAEKERQEKLAANKRHRERINREAMDSLVVLHYNPDVAYSLIEQIAAGQIKHVTIQY
jgi:colicin import membrane protein